MLSVKADGCFVNRQNEKLKHKLRNVEQKLYGSLTFKNKKIAC